MTNSRMLIVAAALAAPGAGCAKRQSTMAPAPQVNPPPKVEASADARASELDTLSRQFAETARRLPGANPEEHRRAMRQAFADLARILPILYGPNPTGALRQHLQIVEGARTQLAAAPKGLSLDPTIDTGLRATGDSLAALATRAYFDRPELARTLDQLASTLASLDTARGPMHEQTAAEAVSLASQAIRQMSETLGERLGEAPPASKPASPQS